MKEDDVGVFPVYAAVNEGDGGIGLKMVTTIFGRKEEEEVFVWFQ